MDSSGASEQFTSTAKPQQEEVASEGFYSQENLNEGSYNINQCFIMRPVISYNLSSFIKSDAFVCVV